MKNKIGLLFMAVARPISEEGKPKTYAEQTFEAG